LGELAEEFTARVRRGEMPAVEEYAARHPALAERIRGLFPTLLLLEGMAAGGQAGATSPRGEALAPGSLFGAYRIVREVGRGGMGVVYEAMHLALDRRVALKVLPVSGPRAAAQLERFLREARTAAGLHHTNIVPVFDVGQVGGTPYYAMQLIDGTSLDRGPGAPATADLDPNRTLDQPAQPPSPADTPLSPRHPVAPSHRHYQWVAEAGVQAAEALAYAHARGVIHRDIKPSNLLLDGQGVVWVTDFGLARRLDDAALTHSGQLLGTPRYMSPEQAEATKSPVDHRTDVYSLGATLYELLTRRPPFDGPTPLDVVLQILERTPASPRRLDPKVPRDLETIILKAMARRREDRYQTAQGLADDLRRFLANEPIKARRVGVLGRTARWARRNPAVAGLLAAVFLVKLVGIAVSTFFAVEAREQAREADAARVKAGREAERNRRLGYAASINLAQIAFNDRQFGRAHELLLQACPGPKQEDLRGWEWHYLWRALHRETRRQALPGDVLALSPDGSRVAYLDTEGLAIRDVASGRVLAHDRSAERPSYAEFSPDSRWFAHGGLTEDKYTVLAPGTDRRYPPLPVEGRIFALAMGPKHLAVAVARDRQAPLNPLLLSLDLEIREPATGKLVRLIPAGKLGELTAICMAFSTDGRLLGVLGGEELTVWEADRGVKRFAVPRGTFGQGQPSAEAAFDPTGKLLAVVEPDGKVVTLYDPTDGKRVRSLPPLPDTVVALCFNADGRLLAVGQESGAARVLDLSGESAPQNFYHTDGPVEHLAFSRDGRRLLAARGNTLVEWDLGRPDRLLVPGRDKDTLFFTALSPDGKRLAATTVAKVKQGQREPVHLIAWDLPTGRELLRCPLRLDTQTLSLQWAPDGRALALWYQEWAGLHRFPWPTPLTGPWGVLSAVVQARERVNWVRLWDVDMGKDKLVAQLSFKQQPTFGPFGLLLFCGDKNGWALCDATSGRQLLVSPGKPRPWTWSFSPDGRLLAAVARTDEAVKVLDWAGRSGPQVIELWELATGRLVARRALPVPVEYVHSLSFRPDSQAVALLGQAYPRQGTAERLAVYLWEAADGWQGRSVLRPSLARTGVRFGALAFSADGKRLAVGDGRNVCICEPATGRLLHTLTGHGESVLDLAFSADGKRLFVGSKVGPRDQLKVWDADLGYELLTLPLHLAFDAQAGTGMARQFVGQRWYLPVENDDGFPEVRILDGTPVGPDVP
jgi:serine/threonine protein kinase/WD40 repeat protein